MVMKCNIANCDFNSESSDSLSLTSFPTSGEYNETKCLENKLKITEDSLKQALAKITTLETNESVKIAKIKSLKKQAVQEGQRAQGYPRDHQGSDR